MASAKPCKKVPFASVNELGVILVPICFPCGDVALKLRPGASLQDLADVWTGANGKKGSDPEFVQEFGDAKENQEQIGQEGPVFAPASNVLCSSAYGFELYQEYAAVTESEYKELTGKSTADLKLTAFALPFRAPGQNSNLYAIDLQKFPQDLHLSVRKVKIYFDTAAAHEELYLTPATQIHQSQGANVFKHVVSLHMANRPHVAKPLTDRPKTLEQHIKMHDDKVEVARAQLEADVRAAAELEDEDSSDAEPLVPVAKQRQLGVGAGSLVQSTVPKKRPKAGAQSAPSKGRSTKHGTDAVEEPESSKKSRGNKKDEGNQALVESLDESMRMVAQRHLQCGGHSIKCLESLDPKVFLWGEQPPKLLTGYLGGAEGSVDCGGRV